MELSVLATGVSPKRKTTWLEAILLKSLAVSSSTWYPTVRRPRVVLLDAKIDWLNAHFVQVAAAEPPTHRFSALE